MKVSNAATICTALFGIIAAVEMVRVQKLKNENADLEYWKNTFATDLVNYQEKYTKLKEEMEK